jgi:hypothetical protein
MYDINVVILKSWSISNTHACTPHIWGVDSVWEICEDPWLVRLYFAVDDSKNRWCDTRGDHVHTTSLSSRHRCDKKLLDTHSIRIIHISRAAGITCFWCSKQVRKKHFFGCLEPLHSGCYAVISWSGAHPRAPRRPTSHHIIPWHQDHSAQHHSWRRPERPLLFDLSYKTPFFICMSQCGPKVL